MKEIADKAKVVEEAAVHAKVVVEREVEAAISKASCHDEVYSKVIGTQRDVALQRKVVIGTV